MLLSPRDSASLSDDKRTDQVLSLPRLPALVDVQIMKFLRLAGLVGLLTSFASASVTISATFVGPNQAPAPFAYLTLDLVDCGYNVPVVPGAPASMVLKHLQLTQSQLPATIYGNNEITCGNSYSTLWHITAWADSNTKIAGDYNYDLCSSSSNCLGAVTAAWDLSAAQPFTGAPPPPGFISIYGNPVKSQIIRQPSNTSLAIYGVLD